MTKRGKLKVGNILMALNTLVLLIIIGIYTYRFIHFYKESKKTDLNNGGTVLLVDSVLAKESMVDLTKGLVKNEETNTYRYKGEVKDNYLNYSGMMYRILGIDDKNNVVAVSENNVTLLYTGLEKGYDDSYVITWLNDQEGKDYSGIYEKNLYNSEYLYYSDYCEDAIDDVENITCEKINNKNKIGILSLYDFKEAGGKNSFLNNGESYTLGTLDKDNNNYYIAKSGDIALNKSTTKIMGIRPVITISGDIELLKGKGTLKDPYIIEEHEINTLADAYIGSYIKYEDKTYRVVELGEESVRVASTEAIKDETHESGLLIRRFNKYDSKFASKSSNNNSTSRNIAKYLNEEFIKTFNNQENIIASTWYNGQQVLAKLGYNEVRTSKTSEKIGILGLGDFYVADVENTFTITRGIATEKDIIVIEKEGNVYTVDTSKEYNIRYAFNLNAGLNIKEGNGELGNPYVIGELNELTEEKEEN